MINILAILLVLLAQEPTGPIACTEPGFPWINWWDTKRMIVWWPCGYQARTERWTCYIDITNPEGTGSTLMLQTDTHLGDVVSPEIQYPFWLWPGKWRANLGYCVGQHWDGQKWVNRYQKELYNGPVPLRNNTLEKCIGVPVHLCWNLIPSAYLPALPSGRFMLAPEER